ncbi:MAG: DNA polymerase III subunit delta [Verrucomicrobiota bacterium]
MPPRKKKAAAKKKAPKDTNIAGFFGSDEGQVAEEALKLVRKLGEAAGSDEFGTEVVNGTAENSEAASRIVGETLQALQTLPFFGGRKIVWLKAANFFGDSVTGNSKTTLSAIEGLTELLKSGLSKEVQFVLSATDIDKRRAFYKQFSAVANVSIFDKPDLGRDGWEEAVMPYVSKRARSLGLQMNPEALEFFVILVGEDTRQINNELDKLDTFMGERREVAVEDIRQIVSLNRGGVVFEISNAIARRDLPRALDLVEHLLFRGENAVGILLAAIVPQVRRMLQGKEMVRRHRLPATNFRSFDAAVNRLPESEIAHLPKKKDGSPSCYPLFLGAKDAGRFTSTELRNALEACLEANVSLVTTGMDAKLILDQLIVKILAPAK